MEPLVDTRKRAVEWCRNLAGWFPYLRPGADALALAEHVATGLGPNDGRVPGARVRDVMRLMGESEQRRLVESFVREHADEWAAVCADSGAVDALSGALVAGAARAAIIERRLPHPLRLSHLEAGIAPTHTPRDVLAVTLLPETVWSIVDAQDAELRLASSPSLRTLIAVACERASDVHAGRVGTITGVLARQLPLSDFPRASVLLAEAFAWVAADPAAARLVAESLLPIYVTQRPLTPLHRTDVRCIA